VNIEQLLADLGRKQVVLSLDGGSLRYRAPEGTLTEDMRIAIGMHRGAIIDWLRGSASSEMPCQGNCVLCDWRNWEDHPPKDGRIRTTCNRCGHFIGYRPENV
jgi:hypothetical protein